MRDQPIRFPASAPACLTILTALALLPLLTPAPSQAGAFQFATEANGVEIIAHPNGYNGSGGTVTVEVCIDPATPLPAGAALTDLEIPAQNVIAVWNALQPTVGNLVSGGTNNVPAGQFDYESTLLHEVGHCIGLAHVNAAGESGLPEPSVNSTKSTDGANDIFDVDPGVDGLYGSSDDPRGDDVNLHWYRIDSNDPGNLTLPSPVDASTFARDVASLPAGHSFVTNLDVDVAALLGYADTEAVMNQGTLPDEAQRTLSADGVATILLAASGIDETAGTGDDYTLELTYGGISSAASCQMSIGFESGTFAVCASGATSVAATHVSLATNTIGMGLEVDWFYNQVPVDSPPPPPPPPPPPAGCVPPPPNMVGWWPGDGTPEDIQGSNPGNPVGIVNYVPGQVDQTFSLPGSVDYVTIPDSTDLDVTGQLTLDAWVRPNAPTGFDRIIDKNVSGVVSAYGIGFFNGAFNALIGGVFTTGATQIPLNVWTHVAATYDGTTVRLYVNGVEDGSGVPPVPLGTNDQPLNIGATANGSGTFSGEIDEVTLFDRALDPAEMAAIFAAGSAGKCKGPVPIVLNPGFEAQVLPDGGFSGSPPSWTTSGAAIDFNPLVTAYNPESPLAPPAAGSQVGAVDHGSLCQDVGGTIEVGTTYSLSVAVGQRLDIPFAPYAIEIRATTSGNVKASSSAASPAPGTFVTDTAAFTAVADADTGDSLTVCLTTSGNQTNFDEVTLTFGPPPAAPELSIPTNIPAGEEGPVDVDVDLTTHGASISATTFSVDYDESCLFFDDADVAPADGIPDNIAVNVAGDFTVSVFHDLGDTDGEIDVSITDFSVPIATLADGPQITITFIATCAADFGTTVIAPIGFSSDPSATFSDDLGVDVPGSTTDGSVETLSGPRGDCNNNGLLSAADLVADGLEIFDGDGTFWLDVPGSSFAGSPVGCDANADNSVDAGDISCTVLIIFGNGCGGFRFGPDAGRAFDADTSPVLGLKEARRGEDGRLWIPVVFSAGSHDISSAVFSLDLADRGLAFDPSDGDGDGIPDSVRFPRGRPHLVDVRYDANDRGGELDFTVATFDGTLADGVLLEVAVRPRLGNAARASSKLMRFAQTPAPSFGNLFGQAVTGRAVDTGRDK